MSLILTCLCKTKLSELEAKLIQLLAFIFKLLHGGVLRKTCSVAFINDNNINKPMKLRVLEIFLRNFFLHQCFMLLIGQQYAMLKLT